MAGHSPAPWRWESIHDDSEGDPETWRHLRDANGASVLSDCVMVNDANARLIAAAPALLRALQSRAADCANVHGWLFCPDCARDQDLFRSLDAGEPAKEGT